MLNLYKRICIEWLLIEKNIKTTTMKIYYKNFPVLTKLQKGSFGELDYSRADQHFFESAQWRHIYYLWKQNKGNFMKEINFISVPFADAAEKASNRFLDLYKQMILSTENVLNFNGTFMLPGGFTYLLRYEYNEKADKSLQLMYWFIKNRLAGCFYLDDYRAESEIWISDDYKKAHKIDNPHKELHVVSNIIGRLLVLKIFKDCAKVETRKLPPQSETIAVESNYINETIFEITMLDSLWLNTLVKSDIFNDYGYFEVKFCGIDLKERHLKWIRKAKPAHVTPARVLKCIRLNGG
jgi:hypothetical protein